MKPEGRLMAAPDMRTISVVGESFARPSEIFLDEFAANASLLTRIGRKYSLQAGVTADLIAPLAANGAHVLTVDGQSALGYLSDYNDMPDFPLYRTAAMKRGRHFKLRSCVYLDSGMHFLKLKTRLGRRHNIKDRPRLEDVPMGVCAAIRPGRSVKRPDLLVRPEMCEWLAKRLADRGTAGTRRKALKVAASPTPAARLVYTRSTLCLPEGSRLAVDRDFVFCVPSGDTRVEVPGVVAKTKPVGCVSAADRWLWSSGHRLLRISKYALGVVPIHPELPSNHWSRAMKRLGNERA